MRKRWIALALSLGQLMQMTWQAPEARAWIEHHLLTRTALQGNSEFSRPVPYTSFDEMAASLGFRSSRDFNTALQIRKDYRFEPKRGEAPGKSIPLLEVMSYYSDEPDWGMDQELFGPDQYPELWHDEYAFMGGRKGLASQAHRHMYWPEFQWLKPVRTLKVPLTKAFKPWGLAPERARVFAELARKAMAAGHPYWAARFMGCAVHYLEDVSQPFHVIQLPSKKLAVLPFTDPHGGGFKQYIGQVQTLVTYYHLAFEDYVGFVMTEFVRGHSLDGAKGLFDALKGEGVEPATGPMPSSLSEEVIRMANVSVDQSAEAGRLSMAFFPEIPGNFVDFDVTSFLNAPDYMPKVVARGSLLPAIRDEYFGVVRAEFGPLGQAIRRVVSIPALKDTPSTR